MKQETKNLIGLLWVSKGYMITGGALAVAGTILAMRGAYWEGTHAMLAAMFRADADATKTVCDKALHKND